jgi:DNA repair protein RadC
MEDIRHIKEEKFIIALLDAKSKMMSYEVISKGSLTASIVHPREVYKVAIQKSAFSIIAVHNHPSGDSSPSKEDITITIRLKQVGEVVGIPLLDHIIIGDGTYTSLKEENYI